MFTTDCPGSSHWKASTCETNTTTTMHVLIWRLAGIVANMRPGLPPGQASIPWMPSLCLPRRGDVGRIGLIQKSYGYPIPVGIEHSRSRHIIYSTTSASIPRGYEYRVRVCSRDHLTGGPLPVSVAKPPVLRAAGENFSEYRYVTVKFGQFLVPFPPRSDRRCNKIKMGAGVAWPLYPCDPKDRRAGHRTAPARRWRKRRRKGQPKAPQAKLFQNSVTKR